MPRKAAPARDVAAEITAIIIDRLEKGVAPWTRPWSVTGGWGRPLRHSGIPYTGINCLALWAIGDERGYESRYWMTYRQANGLGGQVRAGERGALSVYFSTFKKEDAHPATGETREKTVRFLRHYMVFNASQIDGLPAHFYPDPRLAEPPAPSERQAAIDAFFTAIPSDVRYGGNAAFYDRHDDHIQMPPREAFSSSDQLASTLAHEHIHWTGKAARLARVFGKRFGDNAYAFEELCAEIGSGLTCSDLGLPNELHDSHASYLSHWLTILKADKTAIIHAASKAEQAFNYLKSFSATAAQEHNIATEEMADA